LSERKSCIIRRKGHPLHVGAEMVNVAEKVVGMFNLGKKETDKDSRGVKHIVKTFPSKSTPVGNA